MWGAEGHLIENFHLTPTLPYIPVFQFLTPDRKVWTITALTDTFWKLTRMWLQWHSVSPTWRLDWEMRRRLLLQETWFLLANSFLFPTFYLFLNWFSTRVSNDHKYLCSTRLYACINTRKFEGLDSREMTSLPDIKKVIYMAGHFNHHQI